ncbi:MAG: phage tail protein [Burkholderiales bacterium]
MGTSIIQRSFAAGEVAPAVFGRPDQVKVQTGLAKCRNFFVRRHGGVSNRPGTQYITPQKSHSAKGRIWGFVFNADQTYLLLFENQCLRFVRNAALITVSGVPAYNGATAYVVSDLVSSGGVNYYCLAATTGNAPPNATYWYPMPAGDIYEIPTPYVTADLPTLEFSQSGDVLTITHKSYGIRNLSRTGHTAWTLATVAMAPSIAAPGSLAVSGAAGTLAYWVATAIKATTLEESLPSAEVGASTIPTSAAPRTLTIGAVSGAQEYNVYRHDGSGIFGFVGVSSGPTFIDTGIIPDYSLTPPIDQDPFTSDFPAVSGYYQQRKMYGNTPVAPEDLFGSGTGSFNNFTISSPLQDNDSVQFTLAGRQVNEIRAIVEIGQLVVLTSGAEWIREGDATDPLTPTSPNLKAQTYNGSAAIAPIVISDNLLYVQARGSIVRDFRFDQQVQGYSGRDLSVFAPHLFDGFTIVHWSYAQIPNSIVWIVRSDGALIGLTYLREHEIWGWHGHDTDGQFEDVHVIPEGNEDAIYILGNRTINGATKRYLERFYTRTIRNDGLNGGSVALDARFMDSHLTYDGRLSGDPMTLSGGTDWLYTEDLTLTYGGASYFTAGDVGNAIRLELYTNTYTPEGGHVETVETLLCTITVYTSPTVVTVNANKTVPVAFRNVAIGDYARCVDQVTGLGHLEGKTVAILADGAVVANGIDEPFYTVVGGQLSSKLETVAAVIHVGLGYCSDLQTLDLEVLGGETLSDKKKSVNQVTLLVESSRGVWAGEPNERGEVTPDDLYEHQQRDVSDEYGTIASVTGKIEIGIQSAWNIGGRVHVRQRDPLPLSVLAVIPNVELGG